MPVFAVEAYYELQVREQRRTEIGQQVQQMADLVAGQLDRMIEGAQTVLVTLGQLPAVRERDPAACNDTLIRLAARSPPMSMASAWSGRTAASSAAAYRGRRACPWRTGPSPDAGGRSRWCIGAELVLARRSRA